MSKTIEKILSFSLGILAAVGLMAIINDIKIIKDVFDDQISGYTRTYLRLTWFTDIIAAVLMIGVPLIGAYFAKKRENNTFLLNTGILAIIVYVACNIITGFLTLYYLNELGNDYNTNLIDALGSEFWVMLVFLVISLVLGILALRKSACNNMNAKLWLTLASSGAALIAIILCFSTGDYEGLALSSLILFTLGTTIFGGTVAYLTFKK
jgi:NADH:ubiquinone oxidoreductase subunit 5 (subunit L)/multisubunit Na+/H+ antiporter MnhA subunit